MGNGEAFAPLYIFIHEKSFVTFGPLNLVKFLYLCPLPLFPFVSFYFCTLYIVILSFLHLYLCTFAPTFFYLIPLYL
jgi:hypothetical protein